MRTPMLPLVDVVRGDRSLTNQPVDTPFAPITNVLDFSGGDISADAGHILMIRETRHMLNILAVWQAII